MSLRYLVPAMGLLVCTAGTATAADGFTLDGYVDTILNINVEDTSKSDGSAGADDTVIDFTAAAQLEVGFEIGSDVSANAEVYFMDSSVDLEQAYIDYAAHEKVSLKMGKMHNPLGLEGFDAPELFRVNYSIIGALAPMANITGVRAHISPTEELAIGITIADDVYGIAKDVSDLAFVIDASYSMPGTVDIAGGIVVESGTVVDYMAIDVNATFTMLKDSGITMGVDFWYVDMDVANGIGAMFMANMELNEKMAVTGMLSYLEPNDETEDDEDIEVALALLTMPTGDPNFAINAELQYIIAGEDDADELGIYLEWLAQIP